MPDIQVVTSWPWFHDYLFVFSSGNPRDLSVTWCLAHNWSIMLVPDPRRVVRDRLELAHVHQRLWWTLDLPQSAVATACIPSSLRIVPLSSGFLFNKFVPELLVNLILRVRSLGWHRSAHLVRVHHVVHWCRQCRSFRQSVDRFHATGLRNGMSHVRWRGRRLH